MRFSGPESPFRGRLAVPGDKSLSHRALFLAGMARGESRLRGLGPGADVRSTISILRRLGVHLEGERLASAGVADWADPGGPLDAGNSATTMRLLAGAVAATGFTTTIVGDASLSQRPMRRLVEPLATLGAAVVVSTAGTAPLVVTGAPLRGAEVDLPLPSAQIRTAVALAALQAAGATMISSPPGYRDHTERWLEHLGLGERRARGFAIFPGPVPPLDLTLPGDPSSAAFLWVAAAICPGASVVTEEVSLNPGRVGVLDALRAMGAAVTATPTGEVMGDPVGEVRVAHRPLHGIHLDGMATLRALDELPAIAVAAAHADGPTVVAGAAELRVKETDRIETTVAMIRALGGQADPAADGFRVEPVALTGGRVDPAGDHRIAMAAAVAASAGAPVDVEGFEIAAVSWPGFGAALEALWSSR